MEIASLDDFMSWNDQLAAAIEAGVPLDLGLEKSEGGAVAALEKINALVARRTSQGASLAAAIQEQDPAIPPAYRSLIQLGLASGTPVTGLMLSNLLAGKVNKAWDMGRLALLYPAVVVCLAFLGIVSFCIYFVPVLQDTYGSLGVKSGTGLRVLESLRATLPYWAAIFPLGLIVGAVWVKRTSNFPDQRRRERLLDWVPGISRTMFEERAANFAETLATLLEGGVALPEALQAAAGTWNDRSLSESTLHLASRASTDLNSSTNSELAIRLPPFLRWSLFDSEATTGRVCALKAAADVYRSAAARRSQRLRVIVPLITAVLIGGIATLLYGLALFVPVIEMLRGLASQYAG